MNREFYHQNFVEALCEYYEPYIVNLVDNYFAAAKSRCRTENEYVREFRKLLERKLQQIQAHGPSFYNECQKKIRGLDEIRRVLSALNINYVKMNSTINPDDLTRVSDYELFCHIFSAMCRRMYHVVYLLIETGDYCRDLENKCHLHREIIAAVRTGILRALPLNFIKEDRLNGIYQIKAITDDGKEMIIDKNKVLELFNLENKPPVVVSEPEQQDDVKSVTSAGTSDDTSVCEEEEEEPKPTIHIQEESKTNIDAEPDENVKKIITGAREQLVRAKIKAGK